MGPPDAKRVMGPPDSRWTLGPPDARSRPPLCLHWPRLASHTAAGGCRCRLLRVATAGLVLLCLYYIIYTPWAFSWRAGDRPAPSGGHNSSAPVVLVPTPDDVCIRWTAPAWPAQSGDDATPLPPIAFLSGVKNPCWLQDLTQQSVEFLEKNCYANYTKNRSIFSKRAQRYRPFVSEPASVLRLRCLPYFYIVGQPKCGTTDLMHRISLHPHVLAGTLKGPNWWTRARFPLQPVSAGQASHCGRQVAFQEYVDSFEMVAAQLAGADCGGGRPGAPWTPASRMITGDGSTSTLWGGVAHRAAREAGLTMFPPLGHSVAAGLARLQPRARIIVILREPGDRLFSDYLYFNADLDKEKNADGFHNLTLEAVAIWNNCTTFRSVDDCVTDRSVLLSFGIVRLHVGLYAVHLRQWLETFPRPNILVLRTEDYSRNVNHSILQVYQHLDLAPPSEQDMRLVSSARVLNARRTNLQRMQMLAETRQLLTDFYRPHNERLAVLLGSQRFLWEDT